MTSKSNKQPASLLGQRKQAHEQLFKRLAPIAEPQAFEEATAQVDALLSLPQEEREAQAEAVFSHLAAFCAETLGGRLRAD